MHNTPNPGSATEPLGAITQDALLKREKSVTARESVSQTREDEANQRQVVADDREDMTDLREGVAQTREELVALREQLASTREKFILEGKAVKALMETQMVKLLQANEQLVIATLRAQTLTDEVQMGRELMSHMAHHDFLTELPNRILFKERLNQAIALAERHHSKLAILFIDLDRFKTINDSLGHAIGDILLKSVAQRLLASMRSTDTVSRQGGDEFLVLLSEIADEQAVSAIADKICQAVAAPYLIGNQELYMGVTIGISVYPDDDAEADALIRNADVAMYHAKNNGRDKYQFFRAEMHARTVERQSVEVDLQCALKQQQFELYYQAQIDLQTGGIIGVEALIRWHHPRRGLLLPAVFVTIAEECGMIVPIGRWVLREACSQTQAWLDAGLALRGISVNISAVEINADNFFDYVQTVLRDTGLAPLMLELELTETVLMKNAEATMTMLQALKAMGVKIAIDDFGTGYSSLSYLQQFPVDTLKIDQSFVAGVPSNGNDDVLVDTVIGLGKSLRYRVIAEGIETRQQLDFLSSHHCAEGQGYYLSPPMCAEAFSVLFKVGVAADLFPRFNLQ